MVYVDPTCIKIRSLPNNCLHWIADKYDDRYVLDYDFEINEHCPDHQCEHIKFSTRSSQLGCGNPWNLMTDAEMTRIRKTQPKRNLRPCHSNNGDDVMMDYEKNISFEEAQKDIIGMLGGDCWGVYVKNRETGEPVHVYFDSRQHLRDKYDEDSGQNIRFNLLENKYQCLTKCLENAIRNNCVVCVVTGGKPFWDMYYYGNSDGTFDKVKIKYEWK
jgi:hypothetical protein